ncbi:RNA-binding protein [Colletotrichum sp. SAR 10_70]|nr:RNA-binding protein [Colletotrichum sp. SAR 10_71]KAI8172572.1 RNA-binding protein [Colletotrichum sp. SAR 10_70]KAI8179991.1 RNA-binding protein [Colletotrichum sp. SAR 10_75]KAI8192999.1 RNA-binding protein [Colletotrichum sp. SAR 10_65]KAI8205786.1 RNA-binding protein [Colletotrichum sp. SAR 10_76]KAI8226778.1 RNA-binding protein [Colletotrichum sp. SAR 10_86]KAI8240742.1 RNA-binding protein [Colletotrichum sp. SAR 10_77]KAJ5001323.1 RNA-binding protein [Colletotrichum sp. SAR 10_66]
MSGLDVEALLDATAKSSTESKPKTIEVEDRPNGDRPERRDRDRGRDGSRDRDYDRRRRDRDRRERSSTRSRRGTPEEHKASTPRSDAGSHKNERDRRTVFVQQLAARLRTRDLKAFFEKVGPVNEAQIVKDRISQRSKGVGYVEFKNEESVTQALQLTGQKLLGIPIIVQLTEAEKNRQVRNSETATGAHPNSIPFHRLYVGNIHFNVTEQDLQAVFEPFGELEFVQLQKDDNGRSRGYGFVQYREASQAREALEKMNGFDLAGRPIRVGLGNDKFTPESTANMLQRFPGQNQAYQGSAFSGAGGRGPQTSAFDRAGGRDSEKSGGASALDDTDVAGVNFNNYSRDALMRKLARTDEASNGADERQVLKPKTEIKPLPVNVSMASRCVVLHNMFDPEEEDGDDWAKELEDDVRQEAEKKYGRVVHIAVDPNSKGDIYLKFDKVQGGENAIRGLNGRYFGGRMIDASPVVDAVYSSLFSRTRAI